jgi:Xaa-Pro aminopeptidase
MGSDDVEAINAISGERCNPHPHNFTDRIIRPGDQAFFDILQSYQGYRTCYYRTFNVGRATPAQHDAYKKCREWLDRAIELIKPGISPTRSRRSGRRRRSSASRRDGGVRPAVRPRPRPRPARAADHLAARLARSADGDQDRHGLRARDLLPGFATAYSAARIEEEVVVTDKGCQVITLKDYFPAEDRCRSPNGVRDGIVDIGGFCACAKLAARGLHEHADRRL